MASPTPRTIIESKLRIDGKPVTVQVLRNPTVEDVVVVEAKLYLASLDRGDSSITTGHRVPLDVRDHLVRLGVER